MLCVYLFTPSASAATYVPNFDPSAQAAYMVNLDSGMVIYEKDPDAMIEPSALAQLMTVILAFENSSDPSTEMVTMKGYIQDEMHGKNQQYGGIRLAGLYRGEEISLLNLIYAVMLRDANEAAMMIADYIGDGSEPYFVTMMNNRAKELGAHNTNFTSAHGLPDPTSYTTAKDIAIIAQHAMTIQDMPKIIGTSSYDGGPTNVNEHLHWTTTNRFLLSSSPFSNPAVQGVKTAYHPSLGSYAVSIAKRDGYSYLTVLLASSITDTEREISPLTSVFDESNRLYSWAFSTFKVKTMLERGKSFGEVPLKLAWNKDFLRIMSDGVFTTLIPDEIEASSIQFDLVVPEHINAPVEKGDKVGVVNLILAGEVLGTVDVVSAETVEVSRVLLLFSKLLGLTQTFVFKFVLVFLMVLIIVYLVIMVMKNRNRRRYKRKKDIYR